MNPYYAVIFSSKRNAVDEEGYETMSARMLELARQQEGFVDVESVEGGKDSGKKHTQLRISGKISDKSSTYRVMGPIC